MRRWTIRTKLTLWYAGSVGAISLLGTLLLYYGFVYVSARSVDIFLHEEAEALGSYLLLSPSADAQTYIAQLLAEKEILSGHNKYVQIRNDKGEVRERSANLSGRGLTSEAASGSDGQSIRAGPAMPGAVWAPPARGAARQDPARVSLLVGKRHQT